MFKIALLVAGIFSLSGIYDYQLTDIDGNQINLSDFQGKKILFVNTASNSQFINQYASLEQLYQQYKDSLVIIAIPSNSFSNEPDSWASIKSFVTSNYDIHYILASKLSVSGADISPLYQWLTQASLNNAMNNAVDTDFFKYLVDENGHLVAAFAGSVDPMSDELKNMIHTQ